MSADTLELITRADDDFTRGDKLTLVTQALDVSVLRERFEDFMTKLQSIVRTDEQRAGAFRLEEVQFTAEIGADGEFKLLGAGVGVSAKSGITFVLRRQASDSGSPEPEPDAQTAAEPEQKGEQPVGANRN
jgi:hypothetical protein